MLYVPLNASEWVIKLYCATFNGVNNEMVTDFILVEGLFAVYFCRPLFVYMIAILCLLSFHA